MRWLLITCKKQNKEAANLKKVTSLSANIWDFVLGFVCSVHKLRI
jgi:hypothetical protein